MQALAPLRISLLEPLIKLNDRRSRSCLVGQMPALRSLFKLVGLHALSRPMIYIPDPTLPGPSPNPVPEPIPGPVPEPIPSPVPEPVPGPVPEPIPETIPQTVPGTIPQTIPEPI